MKQALAKSLILPGCVVLGLAGCSRTDSDKKSADIKPLTGAGGKPVVLVIPGAQSPEFSKLMLRGAEAAAKASGFEVRLSVPHNKALEATKPAKVQSDHVYAMVEKKPAGIVLSPRDRFKLLSAVNQSSKDRIPIVLVESNVDTNFRLSLVGPDHRQAGVLAARHIGKITRGAGKIGLMMVPPAVQSVTERAEGFEQTLAAEFPNLQLIKSPAQVSNEAEAAQHLVRDNPDLKAVFTLDESSTLQVLNALRDAGLAGKVKLVGSGISQTLQAALKRGEMAAILVSNPYKMGYESVKAIAEYRDHKIPQKRIDAGIMLMTTDNMDAPEVQSLLQPQ